MSDDELVKFMKDKAMRPEYIKLEYEYVLPMNISEVWSAFFDDNAQYSFDLALKDLGDKFGSIGQWKEGARGETHEGANVIMHRKVTSISKLPSNPMSTTINNERNSYLLKRDDTSLQIEDVNTGSGFKYADSSRQTIYWEVYQPTPES